jgi:hypothetical protein
MNITYSPGPARQVIRLRRLSRVILLVVAAVLVALLASGCDTSQQVPWATYNPQLQQQIDSAVTTGNCAALRVYLAAAKGTSSVHEKATGFPNDALVAYIQSAQQRAGCPAGGG